MSSEDKQPPLSAKGCMVCSGEHAKLLGVRGNREYNGADPNAAPHLKTNVLQCLNCGFIYLQPRIPETSDLEKEHYGDPSLYNAVASGVSADMFSHRLSYIEKYQDKGKLLDIGAGKGEFLVQALNNGWEVDGIEPSKRFCEYAKREYNLDIFNGHLEENKDQGDEKYNVITLNHVLEHVDEPYPFLGKIKNRLDDAGLLFIEVPNATSTLLKLADLYFRMKGLNWSSRLSPMHPPFHEFGYSLKSLHHLMNKSGFDVLESQTFSGKDRGYFSNTSSFMIASLLRNISGRILDLFGNRELICIVARKKIR